MSAYMTAEGSDGVYTVLVDGVPLTVEGGGSGQSPC